MNKGLMWICVGVGGLIGSYIPVLFGQSSLGGWSILGGTIGSFAGIWAAVKLNNNI
jgi:hypothetical protein